MLLRHLKQNFNRPTITIMFHQLFRTQPQIVRHENNPRFLADATAERQLHASQLVHRADFFSDAMFLLAAVDTCCTAFAIQHVFAVHAQLPLVAFPLVREKIAVRHDGANVIETPCFTGFRDGMARIKLVEQHDHLAFRRQTNRLDALGGQLGELLELDRLMLVVVLLRLGAITLVRPKPNGTGHDVIAINKRTTKDRVAVGVNFFGVQKYFRYDVHAFGTLVLLRIVNGEIHHVAGFPTKFAQYRERVLKQKLRRIPLRLSQKVRNRLPRATMAKQFRKLAETLAPADRRNADDNPPQVRKMGTADNFANSLEKSLAKKRKSVYREHRILCVFRVPPTGVNFLLTESYRNIRFLCNISF